MPIRVDGTQKIVGRTGHSWKRDSNSTGQGLMWSTIHSTDLRQAQLRGFLSSLHPFLPRCFMSKHPCRLLRGHQLTEIVIVCESCCGRFGASSMLHGPWVGFTVSGHWWIVMKEAPTSNRMRSTIPRYSLVCRQDQHDGCFAPVRESLASIQYKSCLCDTRASFMG